MTMPNPLLASAAARLPLLEGRLEEARDALQVMREMGADDTAARQEFQEVSQQLAQMRAALEQRGLIRKAE